MFHNDIRQRFEQGEQKVVNAMRFWADLTDKAKRCLLDGHLDKIGGLLNAGFDKRRQIYRISNDNIRMVEAARSIGASATFTGSGGAIVGAYADERMFTELRKTLRPAEYHGHQTANRPRDGKRQSMIRKAVIPAAGFGTRFLPATKSQPKEMLPIVDTPVIQYVVEEAVQAGITDLLMIIGKGKRSIEEHFDRSFQLESQLEAQGKTAELQAMRRISELADIHFVWQKEMRGLGDAVNCARYHIHDEPFVVLLGDTVIDSAKPAARPARRAVRRAAAAGDPARRGGARRR